VASDPRDPRRQLRRRLVDAGGDGLEQEISLVVTDGVVDLPVRIDIDVNREPGEQVDVDVVPNLVLRLLGPDDLLLEKLPRAVEIVDLLLQLGDQPTVVGRQKGGVIRRWAGGLDETNLLLFVQDLVEDLQELLRVRRFDDEPRAAQLE